MSGPFRLDKGGLINRTRAVNFTFNGRALMGFSGDTVASAILGAGVRVVGRGMKFHRPRGVLSAGMEEPNALITLGTTNRRESSVRATMQPLTEGLEVTSQNCWPSLEFDVGRLNDVFHPLFPAGFYNKTFKWPSWHTFEPIIRRVAGLGVAPDGIDPDRYEWRNAHCDVLVVGGGAAGMLAAYLAGRSGARVILLESDVALGGELNWCATKRSLAPALTQLSSIPSLRVLLRTTAVGFYDHGFVTALEKLDAREAADTRANSSRERWWRIRAKRIVLATGAFEQPLAFPFNDRPGIMLADAIRHYVNRYAVAAGQRVALATNNDSAYQVALDLRAAGIEVPCLLDTRAHPPTALAAAARSAGVAVHHGARILRTDGDTGIHSLEFTANGAAHTNGNSVSHARPTLRIQCDALGMSGGWNPVAHLYCQAGGKLRFDAHNVCLVPDGQHELIQAVGGAAAQFDRRAAMDETRNTITVLLDSLGSSLTPSLPLWPETPASAGIPSGAGAGAGATGQRIATGALGYSEIAHRDRTWLDFQHDVTVSDIDLAVRENLVSVEHVKRYTTVGMSIDQGKTSNLNAMAVLAELTKRTIPEVGTTTFRPMFVPVTLGAIAGGRNGNFYRPKRLLAAHEHHVRLQAHFEDYGNWQKPACYLQPNESQNDAIQREMQAVRAGVGLYDASTLGKFLVRGPDAAEFLNRIYANSVDTLQPGRVRYGLMLSEQGIVIDDGVCARLSKDEFWVNTSSGGAARISAWFEEWLQGEWPQLQVVVTDVTSGWTTLNLAGPKAREVLTQLRCDIDLRRDAFPHMQVRTGMLCGVPCRMLRVSFTGELSYEVSVPADFGAALWERLYEAGKPFGITPFGVETILAMRTEKGYLHVGGDTDGTTVPDDIGFGAAIAKKSSDFVGRRSLTLPEHTKTDRLQLVGLRCIDMPDGFTAGAHLLDESLGALPQLTAGYLTSAIFSASLGKHVGIGLLRNGRARLGQTVHVVDGGKLSRAEVVNPSHYDPSGARLDA